MRWKFTSTEIRINKSQQQQNCKLNCINWWGFVQWIGRFGDFFFVSYIILFSFSHLIRILIDCVVHLVGIFCLRVLYSFQFFFQSFTQANLENANTNNFFFSSRLFSLIKSLCLFWFAIETHIDTRNVHNQTFDRSKSKSLCFDFAGKSVQFYYTQHLKQFRIFLRIVVVLRQTYS